MLGDASDFTPLDLLGSLGLNAAATHFACQDGTLRTGFKVGAKKQVEAYTDARFLGGLAAALAGQFGPPMARRVGHDVATGLLGSFIATETCRKAAERKKQHIEMVPDQITETPPADSAPAGKGAKGVKSGGGNYARGSMNSSYGW
jgi:hypothetical protein